MSELGKFLMKAAAFCLIGAGAAVASIGMPLIEYAQEERVLRYQVEEAIGVEPSSESCVAVTAKDWLAECKTALYMQAVIDGAKVQLNRWIQILTLLGIALGVSGGAIFLRAALLERREASTS